MWEIIWNFESQYEMQWGLIELKKNIIGWSEKGKENQEAEIVFKIAVHEKCSCKKKKPHVHLGILTISTQDII